MALTLEEANRMVRAALDKAKELNIKLSVAVCDEGGHLMAFNRMEGAIWISASVAQGKATTATGFGRASGEIQVDSPSMQAIVASQGGRMIAAQGAVPVYRGGNLIGAVGGSGGTAQEDEECAQAGVAAL